MEKGVWKSMLSSSKPLPRTVICSVTERSPHPSSGASVAASLLSRDGSATGHWRVDHKHKHDRKGLVTNDKILLSLSWLWRHFRNQRQKANTMTKIYIYMVPFLLRLRKSQWLGSCVPITRRKITYTFLTATTPRSPSGSRCLNAAELVAAQGRLPPLLLPVRERLRNGRPWAWATPFLPHPGRLNRSLEVQVVACAYSS